jgi:hypothetical protein
MDINCYESYRRPRRKQLEMVLTRHERESLLTEWGVPTHLIACGTRSALKVKNQRKQTVVNTGKVGRLEEAIESTSRRFKEVFSLRSTGRSNHAREDESEVRTIARWAIRVGTDAPRAVDGDPQGNFISAMSTEPRTANFESNVLSEASKGTVITESYLDQFQEINDDVSNDNVSNDDVSNDDAYTLGATTFGNNSLSPSELELEEFYQELELEMFGEQTSIPCMIGQTLEVGTYENDIDGPLDNTTRTTGSFFHPYVRNQMARVIANAHDHGLRLDEYQIEGQSVGCRSPSSHYHLSDFPYLSPAPAMQCTPIESTWTKHSAHPQRMLGPCDGTSRHDTLSNYKSESCYGNSKLNFSSAQRQLYHFQVSTPNQMMPWNEHARRYHANDTPPFLNVDTRYEEQRFFDGPRISHTSLQHGHLSPHQWMEECDGPRSYVNGSVTIMEDDLA